MASNETVRDVCAKMHDRDHNSFTDLCLRGFADRIRSAHEREMSAKDAEIAKLKAALNRLYSVAKNRMPSVPTLDEVEVLVDVQRIIKEGGAE